MRTLSFATLFVFTCFAGHVATAQDNHIELGVAFQDEDGAADQFRSHRNLDEGVYLANLALDLADNTAAFDFFEIASHGFGAEPYGLFDLKFGKRGVWTAAFRFDRREFDYAVPGATWPAAAADWNITKLRGHFEYDGWQALRLRLNLRETSRRGDRGQAFYGLGLPYALNRDMDESLRSYGIGLETKTLPVQFVLEQSWSVYERDYTYRPHLDGEPLFEEGENDLVVTNFNGGDENEAPAMRLSATYASNRVELAAVGMVRQDRLRSERNELTLYELGQGNIGRLGFGHVLDGDADRDTALARVRLGIALAPRFLARFTGHYRDWSTDTTSIGESLLVAEGNQTDFELPETVDDRGFLDREQTEAGIELEYRHSGLSLVAGFASAEHDLNYRRSQDDAIYDESRETETLRLTLAWRPNKQLRLRAGWSEDDFDGFLFRTDPQAHDRYWGDLHWRPAEEWQIRVRAASESSDREAVLSSALDTYGATVVYGKPKGPQIQASVGWVDLASNVDIRFYVADEQAVDTVSFYESELMTGSARVIWPFGERVRLELGAQLYDDDGASAPLRLTSNDVRLGFKGPFSLDCSVFAQRWDHDRQYLEDDLDYEITRYGFVVGRRF